MPQPLPELGPKSPSNELCRIPSGKMKQRLVKERLVKEGFMEAGLYPG